jgi:hypothetical protein
LSELTLAINCDAPLPTADCTGDVVLYTELLKKADGDYMHFRDVDMKITIGGYHVRLENLFNGDRFLGKGTYQTSKRSLSNRNLTRLGQTAEKRTYQSGDKLLSNTTIRPGTDRQVTFTRTGRGS